MQVRCAAWFLHWWGYRLVNKDVVQLEDTRKMHGVYKIGVVSGTQSQNCRTSWARRRGAVVGKKIVGGRGREQEAVPRLARPCFQLLKARQTPARRQRQLSAHVNDGRFTYYRMQADSAEGNQTPKGDLAVRPSARHHHPKFHCYGTDISRTSLFVCAAL